MRYSAAEKWEYDFSLNAQNQESAISRLRTLPIDCSVYSVLGESKSLLKMTMSLMYSLEQMIRQMEQRLGNFETLSSLWTDNMKTAYKAFQQQNPDSAAYIEKIRYYEAMLQNIRLIPDMLETGVVVQRGKGRIVRADQVFVVFCLNDHRPAPLDIGKAGGEQVAARPVHLCPPHIHPAQGGHLLQKGDQPVKIGDNQITQINIFRVFRIGFSFVSRVPQRDERAEQQYDQADP